MPADLHLTIEIDGQFKIALQGTEVFRSSSRKKAVEKFNAIRKELDERFPTHDLSAEEKTELMQRSIADSLVKHNSLKPETKKNAARSTRTFG